MRQRRKISKMLRYDLWYETNQRCGYCGMKISYLDLAIDHKIPVKQGGSDDRENLVSSCWRCNSMKNNRTPEQFKTYILEGRPPEKILFYFETLPKKAAS